MTVNIFVFAQNNEPVIISSAKSITSFVPEGWKIYSFVKGDLNKDGLEDVAMIIENTSSLNHSFNDGLGSDTLNLNPRILLVLFQNKTDATYHLETINRNFIPSENDEENTCLADPLDDVNGIEIAKGILKVRLHYWLSCGSWFVTDKTYTFRYQNNQFEMIGYDNEDYHRASGEMTSLSINFSTNKKCQTTGGNMFDDKLNKPIITCTKFLKKKLKLLSDIDSEYNVVD